MAVPARLETIDLTTDQSQLAMEAVDLILSQVTYRSGTSTPIDQQRRNYLDQIDPEHDTFYVLTDPSDRRILAAGHVIDRQWEQPCTFVAELAVPIDERRKGFGKGMLAVIARHTLARGKDEIELYAREPYYFQRLGFAMMAGYTNTMRGRALDVLARTRSSINLV